MWWCDQRNARLAVALSLAACLGGCFQPLYGDRSLDGGMGPSLRNALASVDVKQIIAAKGSDESRLAVEIRNAVVLDRTGGGAEERPAYNLVIRITSTVSA